MFEGSGQSSACPLEDILRVVLCVLQLIVLLRREPLVLLKVLSAVDQVYAEHIYLHILYDA